MARCKGKGQQFERDVCRKLSLWISHGRSKNLFWRSSQSGGRATTLRKKGENLSVHAGDIAAIDPGGERFIKTFFVECKRYRSLHMDQLFYPVRGMLKPMWDKCQEQASAYGKVPLLIVKENGRSMLLVTNGGYDEMQPLLRARFRNYDFDGCGYVYLFSDILTTDPEAFIQGGEDAVDHHRGSAFNRASRRRLSI